MPIFEWDDALLLGDAVIDAHHMHLIGLLNTTYDLSTAGASMKCVKGVIDDLTTYTQCHFEHEESWMLEMGYPDIDEHKMEHFLLTQELSQFELTDDFTSLLELLSFLTRWFVSHIMVSDLKVKSFGGL